MKKQNLKQKIIKKVLERKKLTKELKALDTYEKKINNVRTKYEHKNKN